MNPRFLLAFLVALAPSLAQGQDMAKHKRGGGESYMQLGVIEGTTFRMDGRRGVMTLEAGVDAPDPSVRQRAQSLTPMLKAAYSEVVRNYAAGLPPGVAPNADYLSLELQRQTDRIVGRPGAHFLLGTILVN
jgi:hypothetical protein